MAPIYKEEIRIRQVIEEINIRFVKARNRGDTASVAALYTEDAVLLPPNSQMVRGREGIQEFYGAAQMGLGELILETVDVEQSGDLAYEIGVYTLKIEPEGGQSTMERGKYGAVWKHQADGSWKLAADIWNSNSPLPTQ